MLGYWIMQFICLRKALVGRDLSSKDDQPSLFKWLKWLTITQLILILPPLLNLIFRFEKFWIIAQFSGIFASFVQGYFLLIKPEILYGLESTFKIEDFQVPNAALPSGGAKNNSTSLKIHSQITDQRKLELMQGIIEKLESHFSISKPFLKQGYGLADLSLELGCTTHLLSYIINKHYGMNFYSLINKFRIEACKEKLKLREYQQKTLEAIAHESGFQNRGTFIRAFKNYTGNTPSDFIKDLG
jgi:AraC-like DNA-binding protein